MLARMWSNRNPHFFSFLLFLIITWGYVDWFERERGMWETWISCLPYMPRPRVKATTILDDAPTNQATRPGWNPYLLLVGMQNSGKTVTLEDSSVVSYKTEHTWFNYCAPWYLPKGVENLCPHRSPHLCVYRSFIHDQQKVVVTEMSALL